MQEDKDSNKMKFNINLLNCFGIRKLDNSFDLSRGNFVLIYAHNGTMKTSLARTFLCAEENHNAADLLDESNESSYLFSLNGNAINHNKIFVYKTEESLILDRVTMMTSENIHLNNFMFEPIIDMSSEHLKRLYKEVKSLNGTE